ncbi:uncharacterized protein PFL1_03354 [Pseudozyma flocculosa PF-1]|uniref:DOC domain-containing protein n=2 Tax=Pseudozyma flocculosa TaxID=84751 RepID=A0A5C3F9K4_9BASI|nr:uncharacterized protein PFL1_03354 [Pseudozyma flocculosa PF-1]EPQ29065.1 hypothetical protein PFL1_03354 [Pseudozyma flocculosa PF-1]SPO40059.1 uncharacterized protein PSFLO_05541 [Pseudozyma flocculosa]
MANTAAAATTTTVPPQRRSFYDVEDESNKRDVGSQPGTRWTLSSFKPGSGVAELRSRDMSKLWQSDGMQPHLITITFSRLTHLTHVSLYLDVRQDDSYTPTKLCIRAGTHASDLIPVRTRTFESPQGWKHFLLDKSDTSTPEEEEVDDDDDDEGEGGGTGRGKREGIWCWIVQVCVLANHLNGKDTHVRRCVIWGPPEGGEHGDTRADRQAVASDKRARMDETEAVEAVKRALQSGRAPTEDAGSSSNNGRDSDEDEQRRLFAAAPAAAATRSAQATAAQQPQQQRPSASIGLDELLGRAQHSGSSSSTSARRTTGLNRFGSLR